MQQIPDKQEGQYILVAHDKLQEDLWGEVLLDLRNHRQSCLHRVGTEEDPSEAYEVERNDLPQETLPAVRLTLPQTQVAKELHVELMQS